MHLVDDDCRNSCISEVVPERYNLTVSSERRKLLCSSGRLLAGQPQVFGNLFAEKLHGKKGSVLGILSSIQQQS